MKDEELTVGQGYAIILLVANDLGLKVAFIDLAEKLLKTGKIDRVKIGEFEKEARNAKVEILQRGLKEEAEKLSLKYSVS